MSATPAGVTAIYIGDDGHVIAHASDFAPDRPGGYTTNEAQRYRVGERLAMEVIQQLASPRLWKNLSAYDCGQILRKMDGKVHIFDVGATVSEKE